jgi:HSP20 family protein
MSNDTATPTTTCSAEAKKVKTDRRLTTFLPAFDVWKHDDRVILQGDIPGVDLGTLDIRFEDGTLKLSAAVAPRPAGQRIIRREYRVGNYERHFAIGEDIDAENITAELSEGVVTIELPIAAKAKPRKIEIRTTV